MPRHLPNIIITGTPGVGKTTTATQLASLSSTTPHPLKHISISDLIKTHDLHTSYDSRLQTHILDEDKLLDELETLVSDGDAPGGWILDYHVCDIFPERWIDLVMVLRCSDTSVFYERMEKRGYGEVKAQENIDAEIFGVVAEEAREGYQTLLEEGAVVELESVEGEDVEVNCERILEWVKGWVERRGEGDEEEKGEEERKG